jgi:acylphosphatase
MPFDAMSIAAFIRVQGLVQAVGFRYFVHRVAARLQLRGYVKNAYDGSVEIEVEGDRSLIEELIKDVSVGPRAAHVTDVSVTWKEPQNRFYHFDIR